jgi:hypothetical protein
MTVTVLPVATVRKPTRRKGEFVSLKLTAIHLDSNENEAGEPLHEVHGEDSRTGRFLYWFETTDSLKALIDDALGNS